jgi:hypothetical protein
MSKVTLVNIVQLLIRTKDTEGLTIVLSNKETDDCLVLNSGNIIRFQYQEVEYIVGLLENKEDRFTNVLYTYSTIYTLSAVNGADVTYDLAAEYLI